MEGRCCIFLCHFFKENAILIASLVALKFMLILQKAGKREASLAVRTADNRSTLQPLHKRQAAESIPRMAEYSFYSSHHNVHILEMDRRFLTRQFSSVSWVSLYRCLSPPFVGRLYLWVLHRERDTHTAAAAVELKDRKVCYFLERLFIATRRWHRQKHFLKAHWFFPNCFLPSTMQKKKKERKGGKADF